jgi:hypothetical protein
MEDRRAGGRQGRHSDQQDRPVTIGILHSSPMHTLLGSCLLAWVRVGQRTASAMQMMVIRVAVLTTGPDPEHGLLHVPSLEVTIVRNLMSCGYRFPEFGRHTPLCWPAPFVILNPDSIATVLPTNTPADGSWCCITTGVRYSACSAALICSCRTGPRKSEVRATCR